MYLCTKIKMMKSIKLCMIGFLSLLLASCASSEVLEGNYHSTQSKALNYRFNGNMLYVTTSEGKPLYFMELENKSKLTYVSTSWNTSDGISYRRIGKSTIRFYRIASYNNDSNEPDVSYEVYFNGILCDKIKK